MNTSNDYYNAYKAELRVEDKKNSLFSLNTIIKIEATIIMGGLIFMGYNNFFSDFSKNFSIELNKDSFISNYIYDNSKKTDDLDLISQLEESPTDTIEEQPIDIKEEKKDINLNLKGILVKKLDINSNNLPLIVEIIKSELTSTPISEYEDRIIIGQI